ncbi:putative D,D-dipeptide transport system permease protein DdpC [Oxobacter pfennigii]|uniref:Putative D,D-dipeptide transport system permease protein DdpC n=1 Tax=Oxobacter pfennigii TaxID=36849 RepID=A0A0N8NSM5_9CLOT|nr:ABC transporter permease [Oxobacter pfennigii]KPU42448.1 putative D,D-dipeptide transport system permease protein DdpC [Oxobacter pfennigii]
MVKNSKLSAISAEMKKEQRSIRMERIKSNYALIIGGASILIISLIAILGPVIISIDPNEMHVASRLKPPGPGYILGADEFGRDLLTRIIYGARVSISVGLFVSTLSSLLGLIIGIYSSYFKVLDHILMRICDGLIAIPGVLLAIALMAALGSSIWNVIIALTVVFTPSIARVVRSSALVASAQPYVEAAKVQGAGDFRILWKNIAPNVLSPLLIQATYVFAQAILSEAALSFLGVGIKAPAASWGNILQASKMVLHKAWWMVAFPGTAVIISVLSLNLLGDGLRDYFDPRTATIRRKKDFAKQE